MAIISASSSFFLLLLIIQLVVGVQDDSESDDELVFAHILFRHGDRNIISTFPSDPWKNEKYWPGGYGQLTNIGRQQQYALGRYLRKRYFNLIANDGSYDLKNIYVRSTDFDRTLMSAAHNLAGMFPPKNNQIWNESLLWQAIPIHTIPKELDHILAAGRPCPLFDQTYEEYKKSDEIQSILRSNQSLIQYLEMYVGMKIHLIHDVKIIYEALWIEHLKNFTLPAWTEKVFYPDCDMEKMTRVFFSMKTSTKLMARLKYGFLIREMLERFTMKKDSTLSPDRSLHIYSAHDETIVNVLNLLGLFEPKHLVSYASSLFFELHKSNGNYHVEIFYKRQFDDDDDPSEPLFIPNCGTKCPLSEFYEIYHDVIPTEDFDSECRLTKALPDGRQSVSSDSNRSFLSTCLFLTFGFVALMTVN